MKKAHYHEISAKEKKHFKDFLSEDEELILATGYGRTYLRQRFIISVMLPWMVLWLIGFAWAYYTKVLAPGYGLIIGFVASLLAAYLQTLWTYHAHRYLLTTRRVIVKTGVLSVKLTSALYDKITHIEVVQGFVDRFFLHHGTINIHTAGSEKDELVLKYIEAPVEFKNVLERLINRERQSSNRATPLVTVEGEVVES